jgi:hypothetical protein
MKLKRIAAGAAVAGALGFASIGIGAGQAQADDWCWWGWCDVPPPGTLCRRLVTLVNYRGCRHLVTGINRGSGGSDHPA